MTWPFSTKVLCKLTLQLLEGALVWAIHSTKHRFIPYIPLTRTRGQSKTYLVVIFSLVPTCKAKIGIQSQIILSSAVVHWCCLRLRLRATLARRLAT
jgi:hypothetical protein